MRTSLGVFNLMQRIGNEMHEITGVMSLVDTRNILDLCMAPGGYSASALKFNPQASVSGATLPEEHGGHKLFVRDGLEVRLYEFGRGISRRLWETWVSMMAISVNDIRILEISKKMRSGRGRDSALCSATAKCFETILMIWWSLDNDVRRGD